MSLRLRLAALAALCTVGIVVALAIGVYSYVASDLSRRVDSDIEALAHARLAQARSHPRASLRARHVQALSQLRPGVDTFELWYSRPAGTLIMQSANAIGLASEIPPEAVNATLHGRPQLLTAGRLPLRLDIVPVPGAITVHAPGSTEVLGAVAFGEPLGPTDATLRRLRLALEAGGAIAVGASMLAAWLVAGRALRPVRDLAAAATSLGAAADPGRRLPRPAHRTELQVLADAFNGSLEKLEDAYRRLQGAVARQREFTADASHDLRTPLAAVKTTLEAILRHPELPPLERTAALSSAQHEADRMSALVDELLELARADQATSRSQPPTVAWGLVVDQAVRDIRRLCAPRHVEVAAAPDLGDGRADTGSLLRVVRILGENVAHHTPKSASVRVTAKRAGAWITITVEDNGPGVPEGEEERMFERFTRLDHSRSSSGAGLGLAIARRLVVAAGGTITAGPAAGGGLAVRVRLPASPGPEVRPVQE